MNKELDWESVKGGHCFCFTFDIASFLLFKFDVTKHWEGKTENREKWISSEQQPTEF